MKEKILAYIDSFNEITILINKKIYDEDKQFFIDINGNKMEFDIINVHEDYDFYKYIVRFIPLISLNKDYFVYDELNNRTPLRSGAIIRSYEFENRFRYKGPLGIEYHYEYTTFRIWSPVAKEIKLEVVKDKDIIIYDLNPKDKGLWEIDVEGDLEYAKYIYFVRVFDEFVRINDPYGLSTTADQRYNYVIDLQNLHKPKYKKPKFSGNYTDAVIYEASIRDFTYSAKDDKKGTYLGMVDDRIDENGEKRGLDYIASLGVTHLQLMPTYEFGGVDNKKKNKFYNWGYNPEQFFIPSGWYSKNPDDPYSRLNELIDLIDEAHKRGLRVVMDVVFNHVYHVNTFPFENLVPGYYFRMEEDGSYCNASGCGNVIASERYMASRFIADVLHYYAVYFGVSGYRFDLMGLLDIGTMNNSLNLLKEVDDTIIVYGEGWNMANPLPDELRPHSYNYKMIPGYGFFNDKFRDYIKGNNWSKTPGFAYGGDKNSYDILNLMMGSCIDYYKFDEPFQSINYVECHDNYTFYDYGKYKLGLKAEQIIPAAIFSLEVVLLSEGVPFIHAGEEFLRTKEGVENSYNAKDIINKIDYTRRNKYIDIVNTVRDLISIRKEYKSLRFNSYKQINQYVHPLDGLKRENLPLLLLEDEKYNLLLVIKNNDAEQNVKFEGYEMIFDARCKCMIKKDKYILDKVGIYILRKEKKIWNL